MRVPWPHERCIFCLGPGPLTDEHIIPDQIGGKLKVRFLCRACNSTLGHDVELAVKEDPSLRLAVENLKDRMPAVAQRFREGMTYVGQGPAGRITGRVKKGRFKVDTTTASDGSLIQPTTEARDHVEAVLLKSGLDLTSVRDWIKRFDEAPVDTPLALPAGLTVIKREGSGLTPALDGPLLAPQVLLKIAYEFLACHLGERIYGSEPQLTELRAAVAEGGDNPDALSIEYLTSRQYSPVHGLALIGGPHAVISICLFDWLRFRVHFCKIAVARPNFVYSCMLDSGQESCDLLPEPESSAGGAG